MRLGTILLIALVVAALAFVSAPWWTFRSLRDAARNNDAPALAKMIDYDAVREGLADQIAGRPPPPPPPSLWTNPVAALKHMFTPPPPAPPQTERFVSSKAIAAMADGRLPSAEPLPNGGQEPFPIIAFWGPDRARISVADPDDRTRKTQFVFERKGVFVWRLERIVLPARAPKPAKASDAA